MGREIKKFHEMFEDTSYDKSGLKNPKKADLNKDKKISDYEKKRGKAVEDAIEKDKDKDKKKDTAKNEGAHKHTNYMFFRNLETIKRCIEEMMEMDHDKIDEILTSGHDWANDHISTSKDDVEEVCTFIKNEMNK
jgi:hypothetical protein